MHNSVFIYYRQFVPALAFVLLQACASSYEAPVDDRSAALQRETPVIVTDGQSRQAELSRTASVVSSTPAQQGQVGSSATVVRPVSVGGGIRRISRESTDAPVTSAPVDTSQGAGLPAAVAGQHVVAPGDTLYSIAWTYNLDVRTLALVNNLSAPYTIYPGQRLQVIDQAISVSAIGALPAIPAAPAGESPASGYGNRPQEAVSGRRVGSVNTRQIDGISWQWPSDGRLLSTYTENGPRRGIDIAARGGDAVFAAADGEVVYAGSGIQGAGNLVILRHSARYLSAYMHNSRLIVGEGDRVQAGDKIAESGSGPDGRDILHFEIRTDGKPVDPVRFMPGR